MARETARFLFTSAEMSSMVSGSVASCPNGERELVFRKPLVVVAGGKVDEELDIITTNRDRFAEAGRLKQCSKNAVLFAGSGDRVRTSGVDGEQIVEAV